MTYKEETYVLDTLKELQEKIRDIPLEQLIKETHENNIMLKQIIKVINHYISRANSENENDFARNILANLISGNLDFSKLIRR